MANNGKPDRLDRIESVLEHLAERHDALTERHEALTMNLELLGHEIDNLKTASLADGEHIRKLAENSKILRDSIKSLEAIAESRAAAR